MTIYIDSEYKCHAEDGEGLRAVETAAFDGKTREYIEGYCYIPDGETAVKDGVELHGEMRFPWEEYGYLCGNQEQFEIIQAEAEAAYAEGVNSV